MATIPARSTPSSGIHTRPADDPVKQGMVGQRADVGGGAQAPRRPGGGSGAARRERDGPRARRATYARAASGACALGAGTAMTRRGGGSGHAAGPETRRGAVGATERRTLERWPGAAGRRTAVTGRPGVASSCSRGRRA